MDEAPVRLEWHPAIKALGWVKSWMNVALATGVVVEFLATTHAELFAVPLRIAARGLVAMAVIALGVPLVLLGELWWRSVLHSRREYARDVARQIIRFETLVIALIATLYSAGVFWLLRRLWRVLEPWSRRFGSITLPPQDGAGWPAAIVLIAITAFLARSMVRAVYATIRNYVRCQRLFGVRHVVRGVAMMLLLRARQPRRDFFVQTPIVGDVLPLAIAVAAYAFIPSAPFATAIASLIAIIQVAISLDRIRPPTWLFLGGSNFEAFRAFYNLRSTWGVTAVTLLDRTNDGGRAFYDAEREHWSRSGAAPKGLFYDPAIPRFWSLRTRPDMWDHTVVLLIDYVARVAVDLRQISDYVRDELLWLKEPGRIEKTWFIVGDEGLTPELAALIPPEAYPRALPEEELVERISGPQLSRDARPGIGEPRLR